VKYNSTHSLTSALDGGGWSASHRWYPLDTMLGGTQNCSGCKENDINRITAYEMKFMQRTIGYTKWNHKGMRISWIN
jgi:hypothetical protein